MTAFLTHWRVVLAIGICAGGLGLYTLGRHDQKSQMALNAAKATVSAIQKRADINGKVQNLDAVALCIELGGLQSDCDQLRGLAADNR